jgi:pentatricopeptide repeat protein
VQFSDQPDVLVLGDRKIGIEITNFYLKDGSDFASEQRQRLMRRGVLQKAHQLYRAMSSKGIELTVTFNSCAPVTPTACKTLPRQLAVFAHYGDMIPINLISRSLR